MPTWSESYLFCWTDTGKHAHAADNTGIPTHLKVHIVKLKYLLYQFEILLFSSYIFGTESSLSV
jgi:hypothetical protein